MRAGRRILFRLFATTLLLSGVFLPISIGASGPDAAVVSSKISTFLVGSTRARFGKLEFVGGLIMRSRQAAFGAISSIRFRPDGRSFVAVLDTGHWMTGRIERDTNGMLADVTDIRIDPMLDRSGKKARRKSQMDAEGLALRNGRAYVSFERNHRIDVYRDQQFATGRPIGRRPHLIPNDQLSRNGGLETLVASPKNSPLAGALLTVAEYSVDGDGNLLAAILDGPKKGQFSVRRHGSFGVTDGAFLPGGDLLLLERRFNVAEGMGMRLRRIKGEDLHPGAIVDGEELIVADLSYQIDNMEGIDVVTRPDGSTGIIIVSDDNHWFLQRNLMLEFTLKD